MSPRMIVIRESDGTLHELTEFPLIAEVGSPYPVIDLGGKIPDGARPVAWFDEAAETNRVYAVPVGRLVVARDTGEIIDDTAPRR
jgi:hypothetical protein